MKKRFLATLLIAALSVSMIGCGNKTNPEEPKDNPGVATEKETPTIDELMAGIDGIIENHKKIINMNIVEESSDSKTALNATMLVHSHNGNHYTTSSGETILTVNETENKIMMGSERYVTVQSNGNTVTYIKNWNSEEEKESAKWEVASGDLFTDIDTMAVKNIIDPQMTEADKCYVVTGSISSADFREFIDTIIPGKADAVTVNAVVKFNVSDNSFDSVDLEFLFDETTDGGTHCIFNVATTITPTSEDLVIPTEVVEEAEGFSEPDVEPYFPTPTPAPVRPTATPAPEPTETPVATVEPTEAPKEEASTVEAQTFPSFTQEPTTEECIALFDSLFGNKEWMSSGKVTYDLSIMSVSSHNCIDINEVFNYDSNKVTYDRLQKEYSVENEEDVKTETLQFVATKNGSDFECYTVHEGGEQRKAYVDDYMVRFVDNPLELTSEKVFEGDTYVLDFNAETGEVCIASNIYDAYYLLRDLGLEYHYDILEYMDDFTDCPWPEYSDVYVTFVDNTVEIYISSSMETYNGLYMFEFTVKFENMGGEVSQNNAETNTETTTSDPAPTEKTEVSEDINLADTNIPGLYWREAYEGPEFGWPGEFMLINSDGTIYNWMQEEAGSEEDAWVYKVDKIIPYDSNIAYCAGGADYLVYISGESNDIIIYSANADRTPYVGFEYALEMGARTYKVDSMPEEYYTPSNVVFE